MLVSIVDHETSLAQPRFGYLQNRCSRCDTKSTDKFIQNKRKVIVPEIIQYTAGSPIDASCDLKWVTIDLVESDALHGSQGASKYRLVSSRIRIRSASERRSQSSRKRAKRGSVSREGDVGGGYHRLLDCQPKCLSRRILRRFGSELQKSSGNRGVVQIPYPPIDISPI